MSAIRRYLLPVVLLVAACKPGAQVGETELSETRKANIGKMGLIAHMGFSRAAPANSIPAFELAGKAGFVGIETDVRETKDGHFVLYHDDTLDTRTTGKGKISDLTLKQVQSFKIKKGYKLSKYPNEVVPNIDDYLAICKKYNIMPVLHIKAVTSAGVKKLIAKVKESGLIEKAVFTAGKKEMERFRAADKTINLYWLNKMGNSGTDWAAANGMHINSDFSQVTADKVAYAHKKGLNVGAWTVNDPKVIEEMAKAGVDFVTTDFMFEK